MLSWTYVVVPVVALLAVAALFLLAEQRQVSIEDGATGNQLRGIAESKVDQVMEQERKDIEQLTKLFETSAKQQQERVAALETIIKQNQEKMAQMESKFGSITSRLDSLLQAEKTSNLRPQSVIAKEEQTPKSNIEQGKIIDDFTSCRNYAASQANTELKADGKRAYESIRLGMADSCDLGMTTDVALFFVWQESGGCGEDDKSRIAVQFWKKDEPSKRMQTEALLTGCFVDDAKRTWRFFTARLSRLVPGKPYMYALNGESGLPERELLSPPLPQTPTATSLAIVGDTKLPQAKNIMSAMARYTGSHALVVHVGDSTYATNDGACYGMGSDRSANTECGWNCTGVTCAGVKARIGSNTLNANRAWMSAFDKVINGRMPWMTTMGNHDNDLFWFLTQRPAVASALPGVHAGDVHFDSKDSIAKFAHSNLKVDEMLALAMEYMKMPHFYSFDYGKVHVVSIASEDNPNNAYESFDGQPLTDELKARFDRHFGRNSRQYQWLLKDLSDANARRDAVPWILLFTHRPLYHTSTHHPNCGRGGDWYGCLFRETYEPLFRQFGVNFVMSGHSHHYARTFPMYQGKVDEDSGTIHCTIGTGGFDLTDSFAAQPPWVAHRTGRSFGYVRINFVNATHANWQFLAPAQGGSESSVVDETWVVRKV